MSLHSSRSGRINLVSMNRDVAREQYDLLVKRVFDLITTTGVLFTYEARIPDKSIMQMVEFTVASPYTNGAQVLSVNVASLALLGKTVEQTLIEHVEHYQRIIDRR